jgi:D-alanyl-D-alanine carboxypeptidase
MPGALLEAGRLSFTAIGGALFAQTVRRFAAFLTAALVVLASWPASANPRLLVDMDTGEVLYAEEAGVPWHPASLTKMMTAYMAFAAIKAGRVNLDTLVKISRNAWNEAPAKSGLAIGTSITLRDALYILIVKSANDVAVAIGETVSGTEKDFVAEMNKMAVAMGLTATHFVDPNGLHADGQVTSARDLAMLALYIRRDYPQYRDIFSTEKVRLGKASLETNNGLLEHFAGTTGMKTGYICASGLNIVATVERNGRSLLAVVLGGSSARERNEMAAELVLKGLAGSVTGTGQSVVQLQNVDAEPVNMRSQICGKQAKQYIAEREEAFPLGLKGQPSYLTDEIEGSVYTATDLGIIVDIPLPRPRPDWAPAAVALAD